MTVYNLAATVRDVAGHSVTTTIPVTVTAPDTGTVLFEELFEDSNLSARGWYDNTTPVTTTAQHLPNSLRSLELHYLQGASTPVSGGAVRRLFTPTPTLYVSYWVKYSTNWVGSAKPYHPHEFLILSDADGDWDGPSDNWLTMYIEQIYQNGGIPRLALQDNKAINTTANVFRTGGAIINGTDVVANTENRSVGGANGGVETGFAWENFAFSTVKGYYNDKRIDAPSVAFEPTVGAGYKADWNHIEVFFSMNSVVGGIGQHDGVMQYWFNDQLVIDRHDVLFRTGVRPNIKFHQFLIGAYIGDGSPVDQTMWVDNLTVATNRLSITPPPTPVPVEFVSVAPSPASVVAGQSVLLTATPRDINGNVLTGKVITWNSSNAAIATVSNGTVLGVVVGSATITATSEGKSGTSVVTVTAAPPSVAWPNEPAGFRVITDYSFSDPIPTGGDVPISQGWSVVNPNGRLARVVDATAPLSPSNVVRINYPQGFVAGSEPGTLYYPASGTKDHYVGYWFKISNPYSNNAVGTKQWYPYSTTANYFMLFASDSKMWMYVQADGSHGGAYNLPGNASNPTITLDVWHRFELHQKYPTSSTSSDGWFKWWIDGVLCGNYTGANGFKGWNPSSTYQELRFAPTWGGVQGSVAFNSYWQIDHVHISKP